MASRLLLIAEWVSRIWRSLRVDCCCGGAAGDTLTHIRAQDDAKLERCEAIRQIKGSDERFSTRAPVGSFEIPMRVGGGTEARETISLPGLSLGELERWLAAGVWRGVCGQTNPGASPSRGVMKTRSRTATSESCAALLALRCRYVPWAQALNSHFRTG
jgi:hypothetical protein